MRSNKDLIVLSKIVSQCQNIDKANIHFGFNVNLFFDESKGIVYRNAVFMPILQIGELVNDLSEDIKERLDYIPWNYIRRMRNVFAHSYECIDYEMAWETVTKDVYKMQKHLRTFISDNYMENSLTESERLQIKLALMTDWAEKATEQYKERTQGAYEERQTR